jgi:hypothetical protein
MTPLYTASGTTHVDTFTHWMNSYVVKVRNPTTFGSGPSASMTGSIEAYHVYETQENVIRYRTVHYDEWLPWWTP